MDILATLLLILISLIHFTLIQFTKMLVNKFEPGLRKVSNLVAIVYWHNNQNAFL